MSDSTFMQRVCHTMRTKWKTTPHRIGALVAVITIGTIWYFFSGNTPVAETTTNTPLAVRVSSAAALESGNSATFVGTVRSVSEADIQSERGGRVTSVRVAAGSPVAAGSIIATLENASENAAVLQAQGAYEAAVAAKQQGTIGLNEATTALEVAKVQAVSTIATSYSSVAGTVRTDIDVYFSGADTALPGLRIRGFGETARINTLRKDIGKMLDQWRQETSSLTSASNLDGALTAATTNTSLVLSLVDALLLALSQDTSTLQTEVSERQARITNLTSVRNSLLQTTTTLLDAKTRISTAADALARAEINSASGATPSASDAQIKQALGSLRAAQANLEKTILRSPITGTVDVLRVKLGDFLSAQTSVARVAGAGGLEVSIFVGENDRSNLALGDEVQIGTQATGTIVNIAPAIDPLTQKSEVKIATTNTTLVNGNTVTVSMTGTNQLPVMAAVFVPITAVKFADKDGSVFVVDNDTLVAVPVTIGVVRGSFVEITSGIDATTEIVIDARGKAAGEVVSVIRD